MALKKRPDADRLPISQRIDSRMPNPGRRQMRADDALRRYYELADRGF